MNIRFNTFVRGSKPNSSALASLKKQTGFTLIEVMVALVVFSFIGIVQQQVTATSVGQYIHVRHKLFASWIAENKMVEIKLGNSFPAVKEYKEDIQFANEEWHIISKVKGTTENPDLRVVDIEVYHVDSESSDKDKKFVLTGYMGAF